MIWGNKKVAREYLEKYLLSENEYQNIWKPIEDKIFIKGNSGLPELVFTEQYHLIVLSGGKTFDEADYKSIQECMRSVGNKHFVIVEHPFYESIRPDPLLRMKFPVNTSWGEICSGNFMSAMLLESPFNEYYIYGDNDSWGEYIASGYEYALNIIGYKEEQIEIFNMRFRKQMLDWKDDIIEYLPKHYQQKIKW